MKFKFKVTLGIIAFLIIANILAAMHYHLWIIGNENDYVAMNKSGCINIIYSDAAEIFLISPKNISDEEGISNIPYTMTITNYCSKKDTISLYIDYYDDSTIDENKMRINIDGDFQLNTSFLSDIDNVMSDKENVTSSHRLLKMDVNPSETKRINMRLWLNEDEIITAEKNRFHAKYYILSNSESPRSTFSETILKNNTIKQFDGIIQQGDLLYFNGNVDNNYVKFADVMWKILAINEDRSIKLIYADEKLQGIFNEKSNEDNNVVFKDSNISNFLQEYYNNNLSKYDKYIVSKNYCVDSSYKSNWRTLYGSFTRLFEDNTPSLECPESDKEYGGMIDLKIGLISLDEAAIAGLNSKDFNDTNYLYNGNEYYTLSPAFYNGRAHVGVINRDGKLDATRVSDTQEIRPVINLASYLEVDGNGTIDNPYVINNIR